MRKTVILCKLRPYPKNSKQDKTIPAYIPLNLLAIVASLIREGYKVIIFDEKFDNDIEDKMLAMKNEAIAVGITAQTGYEIIGGLRISKYAKEVLGIPTIWGGWHASTNPRQTAENPYVDFVVKGMGLQTIIELIKAIEKKKSMQSILGIVYKVKGKVIENPNRKIVDMNEYPMPSYDLIDLEKYIQDACQKGIRMSNDIHFKKERALCYSTSYGCPYNCGFCANNFVFGSKITMLKPETVGEQLEYLVKKYNIQFIQFFDPNFFFNIDRVKKICHEIIRRKLNIKYALGGPRVDQIIRWDNTVLPLLKKSGCVWLGVGSESGSQTMLNYMQKGIKVSDIMTSARKIRKSGIDMTYFFLFGLPKIENKKELHESFTLAAELKKLYPRILLPIYFFDPYPGTKLHQDALKKGFDEPKTLEQWGGYTPEVTDSNPLVTYVGKEYVDLIKRVMIFYLPLAYPADMVLGTLTYVKSRMKKGKYKYLLRFLHVLAKVRVDNEFYSFPIEWIIFKFIQRMMPNKIYKR